MDTHFVIVNNAAILQTVVIVRDFVMIAMWATTQSLFLIALWGHCMSTMIMLAVEVVSLHSIQALDVLEAYSRVG